jgi:putative tryptophan/tyrosine transport system substrate-binding protein
MVGPPIRRRGDSVMDRRTFIGSVAGGVLAMPLGVFAQQQGGVWRIGFLSLRRVALLESDSLYGGFSRGMRELGYIEGKNLVIELRSAEGKSERLSDLAAELVRSKMDLIVAAGTQATSAAQEATAAIPIVFVNASDPLGSGFVRSLALGATSPGSPTSPATSAPSTSKSCSAWPLIFPASPCY